ncbi:MAG: cell division ATP-binding protein FtsE [Candidatus Nealsonbacteria bacterium RBG_13_36_15]|uniref:Cell division ATP-binding protein FtsE n=1 Tax=Candidatus Nealsonbacteria bacterium RBG_13_36_15 TaxID=1801660 RepID=A0A1G2DXD6_9BACT|nr:MAG: cell division ATP-binding protein FtsE [Candidatus Nealsonbacteria bacterium RBG_13_36_15]
MIRFQNIAKIYSSDITALEDISFKIDKKEFVSIVGKSGAGKTTLLKMILAQEKPSRGKVFFDNQDVHKIPHSELPHYRRRIGSIFQDYKLFPNKTAYENVAYILEVTGSSDLQIEKEVPQALEIVGLGYRHSNFPRELSGGERQRVAIARALIHRPDVLLADEPTGNLDPYHTREIIQLLSRINEMGTTVILATHNKEVVNNLGKRVITIENGRVIRDEKTGRFVL